MPRYEATFEIDSKTDARAVRSLIDEMYNTIREELRGINEPGGGSSETLREFQSIREAVKPPSPGTLRIVYESEDESFED